MTARSRNSIFLLGLLAIGYLLWVWPLVHRPLMADEAYFAQLAMSPIREASFTSLHPPFYQDLLRIGGQWFGWHFEGFRWFGVGCFLLQALLAYGIAERLQPRAGLLAALLWVTHPMALQGSVILDIDNTLLAIWMSLWLLIWLARPWPLRSYDCMILGGLFFLGLWTKLGTPWTLITALLGYSWRQGQLKAGLGASAQIVIWGLGLFAVVALLYQGLYGLPLAQIGAHHAFSLQRAIHGAHLPIGTELLSRLLRIGLWFNPLLIVLAGWIWINSLRHRLKLVSPACGLVWWYVSLMGVGYLFLRGLHYGFAKYHYPMLPALVAVVSAGCLALGFPTTTRHWRGIGIGAFLSAITLGVVVGDVFYLLNYTVRLALLFEPMQAPRLLGVFAMRMVAGMCLFLVIWLVIHRGLQVGRIGASGAMSLLVWVLGFNMATDMFQRATAYSTTYCYGRSIPDMRALIQRLKIEETRHPGRYWMGPEDAFLYAGIARYPGLGYWEDPTQVLSALADSRLRGLIVSPTSNSVGTYRHVLSRADIQQALQTSFEVQQLGEYTLWLRREGEVPSG